MDIKLLFSAGDNLWLRDDGGTISVGVTSSMLAVLGKPEFVSLPAAGAEIVSGVPFGSLENSKSAFDLTLPFPCEVISTYPEVDLSALAAASDGEVPLLTVRPRTAQWSEGLLDAAGYADFIAP